MKKIAIIILTFFMLANIAFAGPFCIKEPICIREPEKGLYLMDNCASADAGRMQQ